MAGAVKSKEVKGGPNLPTLDGWRGVAILMVVLAHAVKPPYCTGEASAEWCRYALLGGHGVALFFALSGFLITTRLLDEYHARGGISLRAFYIRRAFRILPAAFTVLFVFSVLGALNILPIAPIEILSSLLFFRNYVPIFLTDAGHGFYTALFWSLAVEEHFYIIWPLLLVLSIKRGWSVRLAIGAAIAVAIWRRSEGHYLWVQNALDLPQYQFNFRTDTRLDALLWGCAFALLLRDAKAAVWIKRLLIPRIWVLLPVLYAAGIALEWKGVLWHTLLAPPMIVGTMLHAGSYAGRVLEWSPLRWVGRISFSLYLWHPLVMPQIAAAVVWPQVQSLPVNVLLAFLLAAMSYYAVEKPMIGAGRRIASRAAQQLASGRSHQVVELHHER
jgi:peptidoglycan/LPS O-acetylase OafA/YrhL